MSGQQYSGIHGTFWAKDHAIIPIAEGERGYADGFRYSCNVGGQVNLYKHAVDALVDIDEATKDWE